MTEARQRTLAFKRSVATLDDGSTQKVDPVLIMRFRSAMLGCFAPIDLTTEKKGRVIDNQESKHVYRKTEAMAYFGK